MTTIKVSGSTFVPRLLALAAVALTVGPAAAAPFAYITNSIDDTYSVIDVATDTVVGDPVPIDCEGDPYSIAASPGGTRLYVPCRQGGLVVFEAATGRTLATVRDLEGWDIAVNPNGREYYLVSGSPSVTVVDARSNAAAGTIEVPYSGITAVLYRLNITSEGSALYTFDVYNGVAHHLDPASRDPVGAPIALGQNFAAQAYGTNAVSPDDGLYVITHDSRRNVKVIETASDSIVGDFEASPTGTNAAAFSPDGQRLYLLSGGFELLTLDPATNEPLADPLELGAGQALDMAVTPDGGRIYIPNLNNGSGDEVVVVDTATNSVLTTVTVGHAPRGIVISEPGTEPPGPSCAGDCSGDGTVGINELIALVNVALGTQPVTMCAAGDTNEDGQIAIGEIIGGVVNALNGCPA
jgi:YVTN family beta-propeller protein